MSFLEKHNTDDVYFRNMILGLLFSLNEKITYFQTNQEQQVSEIFIPFLFSMIGDEPFLQDNFIDYGDCYGNPKFAEGNFDVVPRAIVEYGSTTINTAASTNKFVRATYTKQIDADTGSTMKAFSANLNSIPLIVNFNVKIKFDTALDAFKVKQTATQIIWRNYVYYFNFAGFKVPVQVGWPDSIPTKEPNNITFSYGTNTTNSGIMLNFPIQLDTFLPQIDPSTERFRGNLMQAGIKVNTTLGNTPGTTSGILNNAGQAGTGPINTKIQDLGITLDSTIIT